MTNSEILDKAVRKAIERGWAFEQEIAHRIVFATHKMDTEADRIAWFASYAPPITFIFNHDFAKALWPCAKLDMYHEGLCDWKTRLQEMVIADDPIKYLGENL